MMKQGDHTELISIVTPAFNEAANLPDLYSRLSRAMEGLGRDWEWILVDDHSGDATFDAFKGLAREDPRLKGYRFTRNFGSHNAIRCGLSYAAGSCAVVMSADLQDPPEKIGALLPDWQGGAKVVWAVRGERQGEKKSTLLFSRMYYFLMRRTGALQDLPPTGADFFLVDRSVIEVINRVPESNISIFALITWLGFPQKQVEYVRMARAHGSSGWTLKKKLKLLVDSVTSFTYFPIRLMTYIGFLIALAGFLYTAVIFVNSLIGHPPTGWSSLMSVLLIVGGCLMIMQGILGEYLWRALDEARHRPQYVIEDKTLPPSGTP